MSRDAQTIPIKITDYIQEHFRDDFLFEVAVLMTVGFSVINIFINSAVPATVIGMDVTRELAPLVVLKFLHNGSNAVLNTNDVSTLIVALDRSVSPWIGDL